MERGVGNYLVRVVRHSGQISCHGISLSLW